MLKKGFKVLLLTLSMVVLAVGQAFANDTTTVMQTAFEGVKTDTTGALAVIAPIAIGIFAMFFMWRKGIGFFKTVSK